jgi:signal transduction histidine kinase
MRDFLRLLRLITLVRLGNQLAVIAIVLWHGKPGGYWWTVPIALLPTLFAWIPGLHKLLSRNGFLVTAIFLLITSLSFELTLTASPRLWHTFLAQVGAEIWPLLAAWRGELFFYMLPPVLLAAWAYEYRGVIWAATWALATYLLGAAWLVASGDGLPPGFVVGLPPKAILLYSVPALIAYLVREQRRQHVELELANARLRRQATLVEKLATSRERNRLARELHDTLAHSLSGLSVQLQALSTLLENDPGAARKALAHAQGTARGGLKEARRAITALRASPLEDLGLVEALHQHTQSVVERTGLELRWKAEGNYEGLDPSIEQAIYRVAEEALANVERHAAARRVTVELRRQDEKVTLSVHDDGQGFDPHQPRRDGHYGLAGMAERAALIGGHLEVTSEPGAGTWVHLTLEE